MTDAEATAICGMALVLARLGTSSGEPTTVESIDEAFAQLRPIIAGHSYKRLNQARRLLLRQVRYSEAAEARAAAAIERRRALVVVSCR